MARASEAGDQVDNLSQKHEEEKAQLQELIKQMEQRMVTAGNANLEAKEKEEAEKRRKIAIKLKKERKKAEELAKEKEQNI